MTAFTKLRHRIARFLLGRSIQAAAGGRRWQSLPGIAGSVQGAIDIGGQRAARRAQQSYLDHPISRRAVDSLTANLVGPGIMPQSRHPTLAERIDDMFRAWSERCDFEGRADFPSLQAALVRSIATTGEAFVLFRPERLGGLVPPLRLQLIAPDQVPAELHEDHRDGSRIRAGVEFDAAGRRRAYHVYPERPSEAPVHGLRDPIRVDAADVLHIFLPLDPGQVRGLSWLAPVLLAILDYDAFQDATLMRQKVQALFAGFIVDPEGDRAGLASDVQSTGIAQHGLEPGTLQALAPGQDIRFSDPGKGGEAYASYSQVTLRTIAAGIGLPYELVSGDYSATNYSSARAALIEFRRWAEQVQHQLLINQFCRPVWRRLITTAAITGALSAREFERAPERLYLVDWALPAWSWVDPEKEIRAEIEAIEAGIKSRSQVIRERGRDPDRVDVERASDRAREDALNVPIAPSEGQNAPERTEAAADAAT